MEPPLDEEIQLPASNTPSAPAQIKDYLRVVGLADADVALEPAGAGNMNCVWRARMPGRPSVILKQARAWVEKYPSIAAPVQRSEAEARFYRRIEQSPAVAAHMPRLLLHDARSHLLVIEDLEPAETCDNAYSGHSFTEADLSQLAEWLGALHAIQPLENESDVFANREMRSLNHAHIFDLPLRIDGPFDAMLESVSPGLAVEAARVRSDPAYVAAVRRLGDRYLGECDVPRLLHGDLFPGSLLKRPDGKLWIIDPEFSFFGDPSFDIGVFAAHLVLSGHKPDLVTRWFELHTANRERRQISQAFAGVEIMRRLIGVAQLPLHLTLTEKASLLSLSQQWVMSLEG